jgi:hypothetical protein
MLNLLFLHELHGTHNEGCKCLMIDVNIKPLSSSAFRCQERMDLSFNLLHIDLDRDISKDMQGVGLPCLQTLQPSFNRGGS